MMATSTSFELLRHVDQRLVTTGVVETKPNQMMHGQLTHVANKLAQCEKPGK
jgi:hypothetical protein